MTKQEFLTGDGLTLDQERCQLIHQFSVLAKHLQCLIVALLDHGDEDGAVDLLMQVLKHLDQVGEGPH